MSFKTLVRIHTPQRNSLETQKNRCCIFNMKSQFFNPDMFLQKKQSTVKYQFKACSILRNWRRIPENGGPENIPIFRDCVVLKPVLSLYCVSVIIIP